MKHLIHQIHDELNMADQYIECASHKEGEDRDVYKSISKDELNHADRLMILGDQHAATMQATDPQKVIWEYQREQFKDRYIKLKAERSMLD